MEKRFAEGDRIVHKAFDETETIGTVAEVSGAKVTVHLDNNDWATVHRSRLWMFEKLDI